MNIRLGLKLLIVFAVTIGCSQPPPMSSNNLLHYYRTEYDRLGAQLFLKHHKDDSRFYSNMAQQLMRGDPNWTSFACEIFSALGPKERRRLHRRVAETISKRKQEFGKTPRQREIVFEVCRLQHRIPKTINE